jgi:hypothetical protein
MEATMDLQWTVYVQRRGAHDVVPLGIFQRPVTDATVADFGLSIAEGRELLAALQQVVAQDQIRAYDAESRCCRRCGNYHHITAGKGREPLGQGHGRRGGAAFPCAVRLPLGREPYPSLGGQTGRRRDNSGHWPRQASERELSAWIRGPRVYPPQ